ncbi:MAG: hypothetical protein WDA00_03010 [Eubacteriales bacterium]
MKQFLRKRPLYALLFLCLLSAALTVVCLTALAGEDSQPAIWDGTAATAFDGGVGTAASPFQIANGAQLKLLSDRTLTSDTYVVLDGVVHTAAYTSAEPVTDPDSGAVITVTTITLADGTVLTATLTVPTEGEASVVVKNAAEETVATSAAYGGYAGAYYVLTADIYLNDITDWTLGKKDAPNKWMHIGREANAFTGVFDGQGFAIYGLDIAEQYTYRSGSYVGLFGYTKAATIRNLTIDYATGESYANSDLSGVGTIVGRADDGLIENCVVGPMVKLASFQGLGGIVGYMNGTSNSVRGTVSGCVSYATVAGSSSSNGGIVGKFRGGIVRNSVNYGPVSGTKMIGGIAGRISGTATKTQALNSMNFGTVNAPSGEAGGIFGTAAGYGGLSTEVQNSANFGAITSGAASAGGIVGFLGGNNTQAYYVNNYNAGTVTGLNQVGGIFGTFNNAASGTQASSNIRVWNNVNVGTLTATGGVGGIVGAFTQTGTGTGNINAYLQNNFYLAVEGLEAYTIDVTVPDGRLILNPNDNYAATAEQFAGTSEVLLSEDEASFAYTASVVEALNIGGASSSFRTYVSHSYVQGSTAPLRAATLSIDDVNIDKVYDGKTVDVPPYAYTGLAGEVLVAYLDSEGEVLESAPVNVGTYTLKLFTEESAAYAAAEDTLAFTITKASFPEFTPVWVYEGAFTYDGTEKSVTVGGLPEGLTANVTDGAKTNAGTYTASVTFTYDTDNYNEPAGATLAPLSWEIRKADIDLSEVAWNYTAAFTYDGTEKTVALTGLPAGVSANVTDGAKTNAGTYTASATLVYDTANYNAPAESIPNLSWEIQKAAAVLNAADATFDYDGTAKSITATSNHSETEIVYDGNAQTAPGTYTVTITQAASDNYLAASITITMTIKISDADLALAEDYIEAVAALSAEGKLSDRYAALQAAYDLYALLPDVEIEGVPAAAEAFDAAVTSYNLDIEEDNFVYEEALVIAGATIAVVLPGDAIWATLADIKSKVTE